MMTGASIGSGPLFPAGETGSVLLLGHLAQVPWSLPLATVVEPSQAGTAQFPQRFDVVVLTARALDGGDTQRRAVIHSAVQHLHPDGQLVVLHTEREHPSEFATMDLEAAATGAAGELLFTCLRRGGRFTVHDLLFEARSTTTRLTPSQLHDRLRTDDAPLVVDTRSPIDRDRYGTIDGAIHLPRTVLEWRLDPANGSLHPSVTGFEQPLVIVCNHGYSSTVAAAAVQRLGYTDVADLVGGIQAWRNGGLPTVPPDHTFVEFA